MQCYTQTHPSYKMGTTDYTVQQFQVYLQPSTTLQKYGRTKPRKLIPKTNLSWNTSQDFVMIASFEKMLWKPSGDASQKPPWNQIPLLIYQGHQILSAQFRQKLMKVTGDALCVTWRLLLFLLLARIQFHPPTNSLVWLLST